MKCLKIYIEDNKKIYISTVGRMTERSMAFYLFRGEPLNNPVLSTGIVVLGHMCIFISIVFQYFTVWAKVQHFFIQLTTASFSVKLRPLFKHIVLFLLSFVNIYICILCSEPPFSILLLVVLYYTLKQMAMKRFTD